MVPVAPSAVPTVEESAFIYQIELRRAGAPRTPQALRSTPAL